MTDRRTGRAAMTAKFHTVTFLPENKTIRVEHLKTIFETIGEDNPEDIRLFFSCGAEGICQKCKVRSMQRMGPLTATEKGCLSAGELSRGIRLACQARVVQDSQVEIQYKRPFTIELVDRETGAIGSPRLRKIVIEGAGPCPDTDRIVHAARGAGIAVSPAALESQAAECREAAAGGQSAQWTAVFLEERLIALEPGDTSAALYAAVVDLGTNTLQVSLIDMLSGRKIAVVTDSNPQIELGDSYEARLAMVEEDELNLEILNEEIVLRIDILIYELCVARGVSPGHVYEILLSGATGMLHLFLVRAPGPLEQHASQVPVAGHFTAGQLSLHAAPRAVITLLPAISFYAGADVTAAILATRLQQSEAPALLLDLGASSKAVLYHEGQLFACVAGQTSVFDGSGLGCGMRPETGAIAGVRLGDDGLPQTDVIGESLPRGVCGSGALELAACLRERGLIDRRGGFECGFDSLVGIDGEPAFVLYSDPGEYATDIYVTARDMHAVLAACGRVAAMLAHLCARAGMCPEAISRVFVSGALGAEVSGRVLSVLGVVPACLRERIVFIGNASKQGAQLALLDRGIVSQAEELAGRVVVVPFSPD